MAPIHLPSDPLGILVYIVGLLILWIVASIPVYFSGKMIKGERAGFGVAMRATLFGVIAYYVVFFIVALPLGAVIGPSASAIGLVLGFFAWLAVFKGSFRTSWLGAVGIVVLAWIILLIIDFILVAVFGNVKFPDFFPF
ncbi:MAG: hypothetical protein JRN06_08330 [Nitrososphaerota archaeon]|nr:hypothetical protein [Nitrososphaerota archaeon]MDG7024210.1 hypothetical protein [Nitrososphaerota archaeon]